MMLRKRGILPIPSNNINGNHQINCSQYARPRAGNTGQSNSITSSLRRPSCFVRASVKGFLVGCLILNLLLFPIFNHNIAFMIATRNDAQYNATIGKNLENSFKKAHNLSLPISGGGNMIRYNVSNFFDVSLPIGGVYSSPIESLMTCHGKLPPNIVALQGRNTRLQLKMASGNTDTGNLFFFNDTMMHRNECYLPQWSLLKKLFNFDKHAVFLINVQSFEDWRDSIVSQVGPPHQWYIPFDVRLSRCWSRFVSNHNVTSSHMNMNTSVDYRLKFLYNEYISMVQTFVEDHPSLSILEYNISNFGDSKKLFSAILKSYVGGNASCWDDQLKQLHVYNRISVQETSDYDIIYPFIKSEDKHRIQKSSQVRNMYNVTRLPIITVGLPKAGTTSVDNFFRCYGLRVSHNFCYANHFDKGPSFHCSDLIKLNDQEERPLLYFTGEYDVYAQYDSLSDCFFPQITHLEKFHKDYPNATFVLNTRDIDDWIKSVKRWKNFDSGYVPMDVRFARCFDSMPEWLGLDKGVSVDEKLRRLYLGQIENVKLFAKKYNHDVFEIKIDAPRAGKKMRDYFFGGFGFTNCWGQRNSAGERGLVEPFDSMNSSKLTISSHNLGTTYISATQRIRNEIYASRSKLTLSSPIITLGFSDAKKHTIFDFLTCHGQRVAFDKCTTNIYDNGNIYDCSDLIRSNIQNNYPLLSYTGDYDAYISIPFFDSCLFPDIQILKAINTYYPNTTFLVENLDVVRNISDDKIHDIIRQCLGGSLPAQVNANNDTHSEVFQGFISRKYRELEEFVGDHPTHSLITLDNNSINNTVDLEAYYHRMFYNKSKEKEVSSCFKQ